MSLFIKKLINQFRHLIFIWFLIILIGIIIIELILGNWFVYSSWNKAFDLNIIVNRQIEYDTKKFFNYEAGNKYTRNIYGLRQECVLESNIDILTIGGSTTDQRYIDDKKTFQFLLQEKISKFLDKKICISNAGVDGHSSFGHLKSFETWFPLIDNFKPKHIIFYIGINDIPIREKARVYDYRDLNDKISKFKAFLRERSVFYKSLQKIKYLLLRSDPNRVYLDHKQKVKFDLDKYNAERVSTDFNIIAIDNAEKFAERLKKILKYVEILEAKPICISQPHMFVKKINGRNYGIDHVFTHKKIKYNGLDFDLSLQELNKKMYYLCKNLGGTYINLTNKHFSDDDFYDYVHNTPSGAEKIANYIYESYISNDLLKDF